MRPLFGFELLLFNEITAWVPRNPSIFIMWCGNQSLLPKNYRINPLEPSIEIAETSLHIGQKQRLPYSSLEATQFKRSQTVYTLCLKLMALLCLFSGSIQNIAPTFLQCFV